MTAAPELRYTDRDLREDPSLIELAVAYVIEYTGEFEPLVDAKTLWDEFHELPVPVARKVLNCMRHDAKVALNLPEPRYGSADNVLSFRRPSSPPSRKRRPKYDKKQCDDTKSHGYHNWGEDREHSCTGVPYPINRGRISMPVRIKVPYVASHSGALIHDVHPDGPHRSIWQGPIHEYGFRSDDSPWYKSDADLIVKLRCKFPSYINKPILIPADQVEQYCQIQDVVTGLRQMKMCPHCKKVRDDEGSHVG